MHRRINQAGLAVAVVCLPDRGGDALVAYRLDDPANGRRWVDAELRSSLITATRLPDRAAVVGRLDRSPVMAHSTSRTRGLSS